MQSSSTTDRILYTLVKPLQVYDVFSTLSVTWEELDMDALIDAYDRMNSSLYLVLFAGLLIMILTSLGFFGACQESTLLVNLYAAIMVLVIVIQLAATIVVFVSFTDTALDDQFIKLIEKVNTTSEAPEDIALIGIVDQFHDTVDCCGWTGKNNFNESSVPDSCWVKACGTNKDEACVGGDQKGSCKEKLEEYGVEVGGISIVCLILEAVAIAGACFIKKQFIE